MDRTRYFPVDRSRDRYRCYGLLIRQMFDPIGEIGRHLEKNAFRLKSIEKWRESSSHGRRMVTDADQQWLTTIGE